jgi:hypothetical protein
MAFVRATNPSQLGNPPPTSALRIDTLEPPYSDEADSGLPRSWTTKAVEKHAGNDILFSTCSYSDARISDLQGRGRERPCERPPAQITAGIPVETDGCARRVSQARSVVIVESVMNSEEHKKSERSFLPRTQVGTDGYPTICLFLRLPSRCWIECIDPATDRSNATQRQLNQWRLMCASRSASPVRPISIL